jgi:hypothetical protein
MRQHLGSVDEQDFVPAAAGLVGERLAEVALADARGAVDRDVLVAFDKVLGGEIQDLGLVQP